MFKASTRTLLAASLLAMIIPAAAQANDPASCRRYARTALRQVHRAMARPACAAGLQGLRWSADYRTHYDWCLGTTFAATLTERDERIAYLRECTR